MAYDPLGPTVLGRIVGANMNSTADQAIPITGLSPGTATYIIDRIIVTNTSTSLTLAIGGFYTAAAKGGTAIVAATQVYSALTGSTKVLNPTIAVTDKRAETTLYFALTVAQGSAATADIVIVGTVIG